MCIAFIFYLYIAFMWGITKLYFDAQQTSVKQEGKSQDMTHE